jgi:hypothetical protein
MNGMKRLGLVTALFVASSIFWVPCAFAQAGSVEFVARATPSSGIEEPVRGFPFFLLNRSFQDIFLETDKHYPKPDMDAFIDKLEVSKELKAWMKKNHWVALQGGDFIHLLKVDDVMNVPEFYTAYMMRNAGDESYNFPKPKYKATDQKKNPAKYDKLKAEYTAAVRKYMTDFPESIDGIDLNLQDKDPTKKWTDEEAKRHPQIRQEALGLAQSKYLVARTETDLEGHGALRGIPPGKYWLTNLELAANVGDARLRWDVAVTVPPGGVTSIALTNGNALPPAHASP